MNLIIQLTEKNLIHIWKHGDENIVKWFGFTGVTQILYNDAYLLMLSK